MSQHAVQQLNAIHSMLSAGHRNLRIERHSLILWGIAFGGLIFFSNRILTIEQFPDVTRRAIAWLILLTIVVTGVSLLDWQLTRSAKQARDEAWSFIHRQVLKVWWLLMSLGVLMTFAMFFYGGGYMIFSVWLVLAGLGLYVHGLFSEELLEWTGALIIAIGISMLAFRLDYLAIQYVAASTLGLGLPLLAAMLDRGRERTFLLRLLQSTGWLLFVLTPPLLAQNHASALPDAPVVSLDEFNKQPLSQQIVMLPEGSTIPLKIEVTGDVFRANPNATLPLILNEPLEIMMNNGEPTGDWRFPGGNWALARNSQWIRIPWIRAGINPRSGPQINTHLIVETMHQPVR